MQLHDIRFWSGTEESFAAYLAAVQKMASMQASDYNDDQDEEEEPSRLLEVQGNVGVLTIAGPLVPGASWVNKYVGITGYGEIREALVQAAKNPNIGAILLDINSGGGAVSGVTDVVDLIRKVDAEVKPVHTYSDGMIASAAYWTGSSARRVSIGRVTEAGSIGVLTVHKEITKMMQEAGITPTVLRAGEFKALGNPYEKLSDKAKAEMQAQLDQVYRMFVDHVAARRGVSYETADSTMAQGRIFIGDRAVASGLVDEVSNFDAVISRIQGAIDSQKSSSQYGANFSKGPVVKTALTEQQVAALAEGGGVAAPTAEAPAAAPNADAAPGGEDADDSSAAAASAAAQTEDKTPKAEAAGEVVAFLKGQLAESQASVLDLTVKLRDAEKGAEALKGTHAAMRAIAVASVDRLKVALGGSAGAAEALSDEALLAEHASLRAQFETKFKAGGVAAVTSTGSTESTADTQTDALRMARIKSTRTA